MPPEPHAGADGYGPDSLGHRVPPIRTPGRIAAQVARLTMGREPMKPLITAEKLEAILCALADRLSTAREDKDAGEGTITYRWNRGDLVEVEEKAPRRL